jgi:hypothetical protein
MVTGGKRRAKGATGIACRRLNPNFIKSPVAQNNSISNTIERNAASKTEVFHFRFGRKCTRESNYNLLGHRLDRGCNIHVMLGQQFLWFARGAPE